MKQLFTIGTAKKSAENFFKFLEYNEVKFVIDVRLNNTSQLCGFSKYPDIKFFLNKISNIEYVVDNQLAPTQDLLMTYKNKNIDWEKYVEEFNKLMKKRDIIRYIKTMYEDLDKYCLLCSEQKPDHCHRRLLAELIRDNFEDYQIVHLF